MMHAPDHARARWPHVINGLRPEWFQPSCDRTPATAPCCFCDRDRPGANMRRVSVTTAFSVQMGSLVIPFERKTPWILRLPHVLVGEQRFAVANRIPLRRDISSR